MIGLSSSIKASLQPVEGAGVARRLCKRAPGVQEVDFVDMSNDPV
jgi:hypothetical protein